jgi:hypothetical protein
MFFRSTPINGSLWRLALIALLWLAGRPAQAGLRPIYGGDLIIWTPSAPQATGPARAWSTVEILLANATGGRLDALIEGPLQVGPSSVRCSLRSDATWPDGAPVTAADLARRLSDALAQSRVSLPPFTIHAEGREILAESPAPLVDVASYFALPWLRLSSGSDGGGFRVRHGTYEADAHAIGGRPYVDAVQWEVKEGRHPEPPANGLALSQAGGEGRPVFALLQPNGAARPALAAALTALDRSALARFFVRTPAHVPEDWPAPAAGTATPPSSPVILAVDGGESDLRTVAERLQILLRDQNIVSRIVAEERAAHFARLASGSYDLAIAAVPVAPRLVQAATLIRLVKGREASDQFWARKEIEKTPPGDPGVLRTTAATLGAVLLYLEDGAITSGSRVRTPASTQPWLIDVGDVWLSPGNGPP